ncbi:MAG TPA: glycosyltransferase [Patescibacteria group bacterium]|nr:glycosyltransferase [Patescibacteria group bacterium]
MVSIVIPVFNEALVLEKNILQVFDFCHEHFSDAWQLIISDNNSSDATPSIARRLSSAHSPIKYFHLPETGKGRAVLAAWQNFPSDIYIFMDADLSVGLESLPALVAGIKSGVDIVVGSRFLSSSVVHRSLGRRFISNFLRLVLKIIFGLKVKDAPCGFKAVNQKVVDEIIPHIQNQTWFFDTELLILAEKQGYKMPVRWQENASPKRKSRVSLFTVIKEYLKNIYRLYVSHN